MTFCILGIIYSNKRRNIHGSRQDRCMRIGGSMTSHKGKHLGLVQLHGLTWCQIICQNDDRLVSQSCLLTAALQDMDDTIGNIFDICCTLSHIIIIHGCKHFGKIIACRCHGILCIDALG